jgi:hypothetical protein
MLCIGLLTQYKLNVLLFVIAITGQCSTAHIGNPIPKIPSYGIASPSFFIPTLSSFPFRVKVEEGQWLALAKPAR